MLMSAKALPALFDDYLFLLLAFFLFYAPTGARDVSMARNSALWKGYSKKIVRVLLFDY